MNWSRRAKIIAKNRSSAAEVAAFPLPEGKPELFNYRGEMRRYNPVTGKYDLKA